MTSTVRRGHDRVVEDPIDELPEAYARFFALRRRGLLLEQIAVELEIPPEAMDAFVELAHSKIEALPDQ